MFYRRARHPRFQTTYEELKPWWDTILNTLTSGFQTTYEELKHVFHAKVEPWRFDGFQTTYEELKRDLKNRIKKASGASRLPMRN